ncbi:MAG: dienelactone hydrolase family protein [Myxococcaceae bacterium]|nr:dienelactone hydrolase family protein [Myxococcaceae bacterium]MCI0672568.1 dienelactone hydrolase family protein [Myxococcaceae bacterium]
MAMRMNQRDVVIAAGGRLLEGGLTVPEQPIGIVLFAHGSGSSRFSPRNNAVARVLNQSNLATLLMDLLTAEEEMAERFTRHLRFNIELLSGRLGSAIEWIGREPEVAGLPVGLFGSSTGAAAALVCAAQLPRDVFAVVSRGGRPDLAGDALPLVRAPTLLIVGGDDTGVIGLNEEALAELTCRKELSIIPGATHLFEEPGTLDEVARQAARWFSTHLRAAMGREAPEWAGEQGPAV